MMESKKKITVLSLVIIGFALALFVAVRLNGSAEAQRELEAERIINSFVEAQEMKIHPGTEEYMIFMRRIVWNEYSDLTGVDSDFIKTEEELGYVLDYAWKYSGYKELYGSYDEANAEKSKHVTG